jgi:hypothetical protein
MRHHAATTFAGAVTDNTATNKNAWDLLQEMLPSRYFQGCTSHGLHLLVKDVFAATKSKKSGQAVATYPDQYPFARAHAGIRGRLQGCSLRTSTSTTSPRHSCGSFSSRPVRGFSQALHPLAWKRFKPCARPCWIQSDTCIPSSARVTSCKAWLPRKLIEG